MFDKIKSWFTNSFMPTVKSVWKAIGAGVMAIALYIFANGVFDPELTPGEAFLDLFHTLSHWTTGEWMGLIAAVLAAYGVVWAFPANQPKS